MTTRSRSAHVHRENTLKMTSRVLVHALHTPRAMRSHYVACFIALASLGTASFGCSSKQDKPKNGEMGNVTFEYGSWSCLFGCGPDRQVLQGASMTILVDGGEPGKLRHARIATENMGTVSSDEESCTCNKDTADSSSSRGADNGTTCLSDETLSCMMTVNIETVAAGDAKLEIVDDKGKLIDRFTVPVRPASRVEVIVSAEQEDLVPKEGVYEVHQNAHVQIQPIGYGSGEMELLYTGKGFAFTSSDKKIANPEGITFFEVQPIKVPAAGTATVTVSAAAAQTEVRFRVVP